MPDTGSDYKTSPKAIDEALANEIKVKASLL
jgi:hypothetical protein